MDEKRLRDQPEFAEWADDVVSAVKQHRDAAAAQEASDPHEEADLLRRCARRLGRALRKPRPA
jgi:hypothetical protein